MDLPAPAWLDALPEGERAAEHCRFLVKLAALYYSKEGTVTFLSEGLGLARTSLSGYDIVSPKVAIAIENAVGRDLFPRELFRPDLYRIES